MIEPVLTARGLCVDFGPVHALDNLDFEARPGEVTTLLGPNGAGKTTLIRCCTGLVRPTSGTLELFGYEPGSTQNRARIGLMPQSTGAWSGVTAHRLLTYLSRLYVNPLPLDELMAACGITSFRSTTYRRLSGGQQQAVNLAAALIGRPELVFLDEPTAGLDVRARQRTWDLISKVRDAGVAVVLTTHQMDEAARIGDAVAIIDHGRITKRGTMAELTSNASLEDVFLNNTSGDAA